MHKLIRITPEQSFPMNGSHGKTQSVLLDEVNVREPRRNKKKSYFIEMQRTMNSKRPAVYIMANKINGTLYTGVTSDLLRRVAEHKEGSVPGFATQHHCQLLVWYYFFETMTDAIHMEKLIKRRTRVYKIRLIEGMNLSWNDLYMHIYHS